MSEIATHRLGDLLVSPPEYGANATALPPDGVRPRYLRITDIDETGRLLHDDVRSIHDLMAEPYLLNSSDIVIARTGNTVGKSYIHDERNGPLAFAGYLVRFRIDPTKAEPQFIFQFLHTPNYYAWVQRTLRTGAQPNINASEYKKLEVPAFSPTQQRRIAEILGTVDEAIEQTEALIAKQQQVKAGLMHELFTRGVTADGTLRPPPAEAPHLYQDCPLGPIPKQWEYTLLDDIAQRGSGHTPNRNHPEYWDGGIKWVSLADSWRLDRVYISETDKEISDLGITNSSAVLHPPGIVVLSRDAGVGKSAITTCEMAVSQHFMCWHCGPKLDTHYLYYWLQYRKREFENIATGSTIPTIGLRYFKHYRLNVPTNVDEQKKIGVMLLSSDKGIQTETAHLAKLRQQKQGLMQDLLTGRVRVDQPNGHSEIAPSS